MKNKEVESIYLIQRANEKIEVYATKKMAFKKAEIGNFIAVATRVGEVYKFTDFVWCKQSETKFETLKGITFNQW